jgi:hypothetical protein
LLPHASTAQARRAVNLVTHAWKLPRAHAASAPPKDKKTQNARPMPIGGPPRLTAEPPPIIARRAGALAARADRVARRAMRGARACMASWKSLSFGREKEEGSAAVRARFSCDERAKESTPHNTQEIEESQTKTMPAPHGGKRPAAGDTAAIVAAALEEEAAAKRAKKREGVCWRGGRRGSRRAACVLAFPSSLMPHPTPLPLSKHTRQTAAAAMRGRPTHSSTRPSHLPPPCGRRTWSWPA